MSTRRRVEQSDTIIKLRRNHKTLTHNKNCDDAKNDAQSE